MEDDRNMTVPMVPTLINQRWTLLLPEHRANRGVYPEGTPHEGEPVWDHWESERMAHLHQTIRPGDLVVDVGTEEGDLSALMAQFGARVFLAEPNPLVWPNVRAIFEANDLEHVGWLNGFFGDENNIDLIPSDVIVASAVPELSVEWDEPARWDPWPTSAYGPIIGDHGFRSLRENNDPERITPCFRIDELYLSQPIDIITMDVEGSELRVLKGAEETLRRDHPTLYVSVHPDFMRDEYGDEPSDLADFLDSLGYSCELLTDVHELHYVWR